MKKLRVLVGCEESQAVCLAFRALGHEAYSCDLKPCSGGKPEWHLQMDVIDAIQLCGPWDFIGLHPVCTAMTLSGNRHYAKGKPKHQERLDSVEWTIALWTIALEHADHVYMENPMGAMNGDTRLPKPQIIQPYYFGDPFQKQTCLWLHNLARLSHSAAPDLFNDRVTHVDKGEQFSFIESKTGKQKTMPLWYANAKGFGGKQTSKDFNEFRSKTFPGIAKAMAEQWSNI